MKPIAPETSQGRTSQWRARQTLRAELISRARALCPLVEAEATATEAGGTLAPALVDAFAEAELFWMQVPQELGGLGADVVTAIEVIEALACADPSAGWSLMVNSSMTAIAGAFLATEAVETIFGGGRKPIFAGMLGPNGTAVEIEDGLRGSAKCAFGSGSAHANWFGAGFLIEENGTPRKLPDGSPEVTVGFVPRERVRLLGNWDVIGLCGTGSYDYEVLEQIVPAGFTFPRTETRFKRGAPWFNIGILGFACAGHAAVALGLMRRALREVAHITQAKKRPGYPSVVAEHPVFLRDFADHEASFWAARHFVLKVFGNAQETLVGGGVLTAEHRARIRQATTWAHEIAAEVVSFSHMWCGSEAIRADSVLGRTTRDTFVATQHVFVDPITMADAGRLLVESWRGERA